MGCLFTVLGTLIPMLIFGLFFLNVGHWLVQLTTFTAFVGEWDITGIVDTWAAGFYWYIVLKPLDWLLTGFPVLSDFFGDLTQFPNLNSAMVVLAMLVYPVVILFGVGIVVYAVKELLGRRLAHCVLPGIATPFVLWSVIQLGQWLFATPV